MDAPSRPSGWLNSLWRAARHRPAAAVGAVWLALVVLCCVGTLPWTLGSGPSGPRYDVQDRLARSLPPSWAPGNEIPQGPGVDRLPDSRAKRLHDVAAREAINAEARRRGTTSGEMAASGFVPSGDQLRDSAPTMLMGTDVLGRDLFVRIIAGGGVSLGVGLAAALISVFLGTLYGAVAGYAGGRVDSLMMRLVDILYGLPYILLVVLLAVASDAVVQRLQIERARSGLPELPSSRVEMLQVVTLLVAIGGVSWLTMARVIRGQVLSFKARPFVEAARAVGATPTRIFLRHLLPNLVGPIVVYATLTVPQAILQESFLSFLGIGVRPPLPSWGSLAADGLSELNPYQSNWWLLAFPCLMLATTLLALNFVGEGLREALDPRRAAP
ncbi:MAG: ABC transporter permease [Phycisphaeraceae bacterium]|nr:ABC transporter permease [Phycisphaeraceae bacterium]